MNWRTFFPLAQWRPEQAEALDFITDALTDDSDVFLEAPTGTGKSPIAITLARMTEACGEQTYISTTTIGLESQYIEDFSDLGLCQLHSRANYCCPTWGDCDVGAASRDLADQCDLGLIEQCTKATCTYEYARREFAEASFGVANAAYLLTNARFVPSFQQRALLIVDEAHTFADQVAGIYTVEISANDGSLPEEGREISWLAGSYNFSLERQLAEAKMEFGDLQRGAPLLAAKILKRIRRLEGRQANIRAILASERDGWVFDRQEERLVISPVWATTIAPALLAKLGQKRIFMSATLPDFRRQARWLGIEPENNRTKYLALPSPFPVENRLIFYHPVVRWKYGASEQTYAALIPQLRLILDRHQGQRGLIHVSSYSQAAEIVRRCGSPRLITHSNAHDRDQVLKHMFTTPGAVLVSPSSREGLDLYGERSRFQVIAKLPYASLGDKRVQRRMADDEGWVWPANSPAVNPGRRPLGPQQR